MHRQDLNDMTETLTEHADDLRSRTTDRLSGRMDDLRDRAASAMGDQTRDELRRLRGEIRRLGDRSDDLGRTVDGWLEGLDDRLTASSDDLMDRVGERIDGLDETSWFKRLLWMAMGAGAGYAAAMLMDPQQGTRRRHQLRDQMESRGRELADEARKRAEFVAGQAKGSAIEGMKTASPVDLDAPEDPKTLRQKIRSEVIGSVEGAEAVVVAVHNDGQVTLKGEVDSPSTEQRLVHEVGRVGGVSEVISELIVRAPR